MKSLSRAVREMAQRRSAEDSRTAVCVARVLRNFAQHERATFPVRLKVAMRFFPRAIKKCEGCYTNRVIHGGLCPTCLTKAAEAMEDKTNGE